MVLLSVSDADRAVMFGPMESKGNLIYKFVNAGANVPIMMQNLEDPIPKVMIHALPKQKRFPEKWRKMEISTKLYSLFLFTGY